MDYFPDDSDNMNEIATQWPFNTPHMITKSYPSVIGQIIMEDKTNNYDSWPSTD